MNFDGPKWIWCKDQLPNIYCCARGKIDLPAQSAVGRIRVVADSRYQLWVNGEYIGQGPTPFKRPHVFFDSFEVTSRLRVGTNIIAILGNYHGVEHCTYTPGPPGILAEMEVADASGNVHKLASDTSWRALRLEAYQQDVPRRTWATSWCEHYDARLAPVGWQNLDFDDNAWPAAGEVDPGRVTLQPRRVPMLEEFRADPVTVTGVWHTRSGLHPPEGLTPWLDEEPLDSAPPFASLASDKDLPPWRIEAAEHGIAFTLDFGQELTGHIELEVDAPEGVAIDLCPAENLRNGRPWCFRKGGEYARRYITRAGRQEWRCFGYDGVRYMHAVVRGPHPALTFHRLSVWRRQSTLPVRATFKCDDPRVNRIWDISCHTMKLCSQEIHVDCPTREQTSAWGDAVWTGLWEGYLTGNYSALKHLIIAADHVQYPDGQLPNYAFSGLAHPLFDYPLIAVWGTWLYYRHTGDLDLARRLVPMSDRVLDWYRREIGQSGLIELDCDAVHRAGKGTLFIDHPGLGWHNSPNGIDRRGISAGLNFFFIHALEAQAAILDVCGEERRATARRKESSGVRAAAEELFYNQSESAYVDSFFQGQQSEQISQQTNALAVTSGVCPATRVPQVLRRVLDPADKNLCRCGTYFWTYLAEALCRNGMHREMWSEVVRLWNDMAERGATSWWETFTGDELDSLCHMWSAVPGYLILAEILGVKPVKQGFQEVRLQPRIDLLKQAEGSVPLPKGWIDLSWSGDRETECRLTVNPQTDASVRVEAPTGWTIDGCSERQASVPSLTESRFHIRRIVKANG